MGGIPIELHVDDGDIRVEKNVKPEFMLVNLNPASNTELYPVL